MGKKNPKHRAQIISIRKKRRRKLKRLKEKYSKAKSAAEKRAIAEKMAKISPFTDIAKYLRGD